MHQRPTVRRRSARGDAFTMQSIRLMSILCAVLMMIREPWRFLSIEQEQGSAVCVFFIFFANFSTGQLAQVIVFAVILRIALLEYPLGYLRGLEWSRAASQRYFPIKGYVDVPWPGRLVNYSTQLNSNSLSMETRLYASAVCTYIWRISCPNITLVEL